MQGMREKRLNSNDGAVLQKVITYHRHAIPHAMSKLTNVPSNLMFRLLKPSKSAKKLWNAAHVSCNTMLLPVAAISS